MWKPTKEISVSSHSVVDLKAELLRKKEEFTRAKEKQQKQAGSTSTLPIVQRQRQTTARVDPQNRGVEDRQKRDLAWLQSSSSNASNREQIRASRAALERKAKIYEKLSTTSRGAPKELLRLRESETTLVDFEQKQWQSPDSQQAGHEEEETVQVVDEFGRTRTVPKSQARNFVGIEVNLEEDYKEYDSKDRAGFHMFPPTAELTGNDPAVSHLTNEERVRREQEAQDEWLEALKRPEHVERYDAQGERRNLGAAFYKFSADEEERQNEMDALKQRHEETVEQRSSVDSVKEERRKRMESRLQKIKQAREKPSDSVARHQLPEHTSLPKEQQQEPAKEEGTSSSLSNKRPYSPSAEAEAFLHKIFKP